MRYCYSECIIFLCYGGGITTVHEIKKLLRISIERVSINYANFVNPNLVAKAAKSFGFSTIVTSISVKMNLFRRLRVFKPTVRDTTKLTPLEYAKCMENQNTGEILINSVNQDGMLTEYNFEMIDKSLRL